MWYNHFNGYLLKESYKNDNIYSSVFVKKANLGFAIIVIYVNDLNIIKTFEEIPKVTNYLKEEFEMKDIRKTKFCLDLQIKYLRN